MNYLSTHIWNQKTASEKIAHFEQYPIELEAKHMFMPGVNQSANGVVEMHRAMCGGVAVSNYKTTPHEAMKESVDVLVYQFQHLFIEESNQ
ncbi:MAG: hypothetical protein ABJI69_09130 [Balneola sp.]